MNSNFNFQTKLVNLPSQPGCYLFKDNKEKIIYVGKAQNLQKRVSSYFQNSPNNYFCQQIQDFTIIITNNAKEALILEQNLIKKFQPRFNVLLKDNHYYPYLEITNETNPRYKIVRKVNPESKSEYYGPFPDGSKSREILQLLERLFPLAKCKGKLGKPCFYYTINQCSGHCWQVVDNSYYENIKKEVSKFFAGKTGEIKDKIKKSLQKNITNLAFEIAQKEKKILDNIDFFTSKQNVEFLDHQNCDFLGIYHQDNIIVLYLLIYRYGKLVTQDEAVFRIWVSEDDTIQDYLYQFYRNNVPPQTIYLHEKIAEEKLLSESLGFVFQVPVRGKKKKILELARANAQAAWQRNYWNQFQQVNKKEILEEISNFLSIPTPHYIECLDVSNLYKQNVVAGFLVIQNGEKNLTRSKLYKLKEVEQDSDLARIKKACLVHYKKFSHQTMPDLIVVDGGKEQVKVVQQTLKELALPTTVIGLAKDENHRTAKIIKSDLKQLEFGHQEKIRNFFTNCQEEVHHYALNFHRQLHRRSVTKKQV